MSTTTKTQPTVNGKTVQICATSTFNNMFGGMEAAMYSRLAITTLKKHPVDMLVFETIKKVQRTKKDGTKVYVCDVDGDPKLFQQIRSAGYRLDNEELGLDEKTILYRAESLRPRLSGLNWMITGNIM